MHITNIIENKNLGLAQIASYAAILGESPSKGAKSPSLWNAAFNDLDLPAVMHPMDVRPARLAEAVQSLREDDRFLGGAVTMPYKMSIIPYLDGVDSQVETIGSVNCIYRDEKKLIGSNTDGAGALWSLEKDIGAPLSGKNVLVLGTGGAGAAVASYLASAVGPEGRIVLANRSSDSRDKLAKRLSVKYHIETADWPVNHKRIGSPDVIVNCSTLGFETLKEDDEGMYSLKFYTPLGPYIDDFRVNIGENTERRYFRKASEAIKINFDHSFDFLASMTNPFVFDIIYQPKQTVLLFLASLLGYRTLNGETMNLAQAVIAFDKVTSTGGLRSQNEGVVYDAMMNVW